MPTYMGTTKTDSSTNDALFFHATLKTTGHSYTTGYNYSNLQLH